MADFKKSDVIKNLLDTLIELSGRRTDRGYAINTMDSVINNLKDKYGFLNSIKINDNRFVEDEDIVSVMSNVDEVDSVLMGKALNDIVRYTNSTLGKNAGHFFIKELRRNIGGNYSTVMKDMGVDLSLMQLEKEIKDLSSSINKK